MGIQHTASISHGNSGEPLFNKKGELVGVNVGAIATGNNLFFSIPSNKLKSWLLSTTYKNLVQNNANEAQRLGTRYVLNDEGYLEVGTSVLIKIAEGYEVFLDDEKQGNTPLFLENLSAGAHKLVIQSEKEYNEVNIMVLPNKTETFIYEPFLEKYSGKLYVQTTPSGAEILIKGKKYGVSPNVIDKLPIGACQVKLIMDGYFPETLDVTIEKHKTARIEIGLKKAFIVSFKSPLPEDAKIVASGGGKSYSFKAADTITLYKGEWDIVISGERFETETFHISIIEGNITLDFIPVANYATIAFKNLTKESSVFIDGKDRTEEIKENKIEVSRGKHDIRVSSKDMNDFEQSVDLEAESVIEVTVTYTYSREYYLGKFQERVDKAEAVLKSDLIPGSSATPILEEIEKDIIASGEEYPELLARVDRLISKSLKKDEAYLKKKIKKAEDGQGLTDLLKWGTLCTFVAGTSVAIASQFFSASSYDNYLNATITADATKYRQEVQLWDTITWISGGVAGVSAGFSLFFWIRGPDPVKLKKDLDDIYEKIKTRESNQSGQ